MKRSSTSRQAAAVVGKLAKAHGKTPDEVRQAAAQALARATADDCTKVRQQLADTVREAAADTSALAQQVTTAKMWTRYERRKLQRQQAAFAHTIEQLQQPPDRWYSTAEVLLALGLPAGALSHKARLAKLGLEQKPKTTKQQPSLYRRMDGQPIRDKHGRPI